MKQYENEEAMWMDYKADFKKEDRRMWLAVVMTCILFVFFRFGIDLSKFAFGIVTITWVFSIILYAIVYKKNCRKWAWLDFYELY